MTRLTRLVTPLNSAGSLRLFFGFTVRLSAHRAHNTLALPPLVNFSAARYPKITFFATAPDCRKPLSIPPAMDPHAPAGVGEDFVHIENPSVDESLSESIVNVEAPQRDNDAGDDDASTSNEASISEQRTVLPEELSRSVVALTCDTAAEGGLCDVYLVGTAHVSQVIQNLLCLCLAAEKIPNWFLFGC